MAPSVTLVTRNSVLQVGLSPKASLALAELALEAASVDGQNFEFRNLRPFLTGRPLPRTAHARLWRRLDIDLNGKKPIKMPQSRHKGGLPSASK